MGTQSLKAKNPWSCDSVLLGFFGKTATTGPGPSVRSFSSEQLLGARHFAVETEKGLLPRLKPDIKLQLTEDLVHGGCCFVTRCKRDAYLRDFVN